MQTAVGRKMQALAESYSQGCVTQCRFSTIDKTVQPMTQLRKPKPSSSLACAAEWAARYSSKALSQ